MENNKSKNIKSEHLLIRGSVLIFLASIFAFLSIFSCNKATSIEGCRYTKKKLPNGGSAYVHSPKCENLQIHRNDSIKQTTIQRR